MALKGRILTVPLVIGLLALPPAAFADRAFYLGGNMGRSDSDASLADIGTGLVGSVDHTDTGWSLFAGYRFNAFLGVEGGYADLGSNSVNAVFAGSGTALGGKGDLSAWNVVGIGSFPLTNRFSLFGKAGVARWKVKGSGSSGTSYLAFDEDGTKFTYGAGMSYDLSESAKVRAQWERFQMKPRDTDLNVDYYSAGIVFSFK
jgi:OOP family OmpA-OmpF porin